MVARRIHGNCSPALSAEASVVSEMPVILSDRAIPMEIQKAIIRAILAA